MKLKRILGVVILLIGIACIIGSQYIKARVAEGVGQISSAQEKVDTIGKLSSLSQYSKPIGKKVTESAQDKIDEGSQQVAHYTALAHQLEVGGIILIFAGLITILIPIKNRR